MSKRAAVRVKKQALAVASSEASTVIGQLVLPLIAGIESTKHGLMQFVHQMGMAALQELLSVEASAIAGPKGRHGPGARTTIGAARARCLHSVAGTR